MSSFFGGGASPTGASPVSGSSDQQQRKEQMMLSVQQELAVANAQLLINKMNENCFAKCVTKPGPALAGSEEKCLSQCMQLYSSAYDQVSRNYHARVMKERNGSSPLGGLQ